MAMGKRKSGMAAKVGPGEDEATTTTTTRVSEGAMIGQEEEGLRAQRLREAMSRALESTLKNCTYGKLAECFPTVAARYKEGLVSAHGQVIDFLRANVYEEYQIILNDRDLVAKLNQLDEIIADAKSRAKDDVRVKSAYTTQLTPNAVTMARSHPVKLAELARLTDSLNEVEKSNAETKSRILKLTNQCDAMESTLKASIEDLRNGIDVTSEGIRVDEINVLMEDVVSTLPAAR